MRWKSGRHDHTRPMMACCPHPHSAAPASLCCIFLLLITLAGAVQAQGTDPVQVWEVVDQRTIAEYEATGTLYRHIATGAQLASFHSADENKVFGITFSTPVNDSKGTPHVLEHAVLTGGTQRYPVKELFAELIKGSLATYLNAMTYPDRTLFPAASTNLQDLRNLLDVYTDVVFHPLLPSDPRIFQSEAWHYEVDEQGNLTTTGVVLGEMRGVYSSPDSLNSQLVQSHLLPNNSYAHDSGGSPDQIPLLTFEELVAYYRAHYQPANARLWMWGDGPPEEERLHLMDAYLAGADVAPAGADMAPTEPPPQWTVPPQPLFKEPVSFTEYYPASGGEEAGADLEKHLAEAAPEDTATDGSGEPAAAGKQGPGAYCTLAWVVATDHLDLPTELAASFLDYLLLGTSAAPLHKALIDSGLGQDVIGGGLDVDYRQPIFAAGLKGVEPGRCSEVFDLIMTTLAGLRSSGFNASAVEAAVNTIEFALRENNTGGFPRGLNQMLRALRYWLYGASPFEPMQWGSALDGLKAQLAEGQDVFGPLLSGMLLDNPHRVSLELLPDPGMEARQKAEEAARLKAVQEQLGQAGMAAVAQAAEELQQWQQEPTSPEDLAKVPSLQVSDLEPQTIIIPTVVSTPSAPAGDATSAAAGPSWTQLDHNLTTTGILYLDLALDMHGLPPDLLPLVPLFCSSLTQLGTRRRDFVGLTELVGQQTGGVEVSNFVSAYLGKTADPKAYVTVRGKAVGAKVQQLLDILAELLLEPNLDNQERFMQLVLQERAGLEQGIVESSTPFASTRLDAQYNVAGWASEVMGGVSYIDYVRGLAGEVQDAWPEVLARLEAIRAYVVGRAGALINLTADPALLADVAPAVARFMEGLPSTPPRQPANWTGMLPKGNEAFLIPTQVSSTCKAASLYGDAGLPYNFPQAGSLYVVTNYLDASWLWDSIRVQGGAYGAGSSFDLTSGLFAFCSWRDPGLLSTVKAFDGAAQFLAEVEPSADTLTKSIVGAIGAIDAFQLPDAKGLTALTRHILEISDQERQARRDKVLSTTAADFRSLADVLGVVAQAGRVASVTSRSQAEAVEQESPGFFGHVQEVL